MKAIKNWTSRKSPVRSADIVVRSRTRRFGASDNSDTPARKFQVLAFCFSILLPGVCGVAKTGAPDLTMGTNRFAADTTYTFNLGPTGLRGWIYRGGELDIDNLTGAKPWQILVTSVGANTPASGVIATNDVILGVSAGAGHLPVPLFTNDTRKSLGWAIGAAEAGDGVLNLKRWRNGAIKDVSIRLKILGAYSATLPYDCPKSARILADAVGILTKRPENSPTIGLALLAAGDTNLWPRVQAYARSIAPKRGSLDPYKCNTWDWSYNNLLLCEYYLRTGDGTVLDGIREYTINLARAQSMFGTYGHGGAGMFRGSYHGSIPPYGPVNQCGLAAVISIVLGKKCGVIDPEIDPAISRAAKFYSYYVQKGSVPYGEHVPWHLHAGSNGKNELAAVFFGLLGNQPAPTEYFARMSVAGFVGREVGHTGQGFNYFWSPLGAAVGGPEAVSAYLSEVRWHLDLARRCDGSFSYDGTGDGSNRVKDYWDASHYEGYLDPTVWNVLTLSLPRRQLYITGRHWKGDDRLSKKAVDDAVWSGRYLGSNSSYDAGQLLSHFSAYDPIVRSLASAELVKRPGSTNLVATLTKMANDQDPKVRETACRALGLLKHTGALPVLVERLQDPDVWVRARAGSALQTMGPAALPQLAEMLKAFIANGSSDPFAIDWADPLRIGNGYLAAELFQTLGKQTYQQSTNLLYPAVKVALAQPAGEARSHLGDFPRGGQPSGFLMNLSWEDVQALAPSIVACAADRAPADRMFAGEVWYCALAVLGKYRVEEGIPLCFRMNDRQTGEPQPFQVLTDAYRAAAWEALPALHAYQDYWPQWGSAFEYSHWWIGMSNEFAAAVSAVSSDTNPPALNYFKKIHAVSAMPSTPTLPTAKATLRCSASNMAGGLLSYTWSKLKGDGDVTFTPNNSAEASNCTATFSAPGTYVLRLAVVNGSILDKTTWNESGCVGWRDFQTYTNIMGAVYTNITIQVSPAQSQ